MMPVVCERAQQRADQAAQGLQRTAIGLVDLDGDGRSPSRRQFGRRHRSGRLLLLGLQLLLQVFENLLGVLQRAAGLRAAEALDLGADGFLVMRKLGGELRHLPRHDFAKREDAAESQQHHDDNRKPARHAQILQHADRRREHEAENARPAPAE